MSCTQPISVGHHQQVPGLLVDTSRKRVMVELRKRQIFWHWYDDSFRFFLPYLLAAQYNTALQASGMFDAITGEAHTLSMNQGHKADPNNPVVQTVLHVGRSVLVATGSYQSVYACAHTMVECKPAVPIHQFLVLVRYPVVIAMSIMVCQTSNYRHNTLL
jgi:hypothetical protein